MAFPLFRLGSLLARNLIQPISNSLIFISQRYRPIDNSLFWLGKNYIKLHEKLSHRLGVNYKFDKETLTRSETVKLASQFIGEGALCGAGAFWYRRKITSRPKKFTLIH